MRLPLDPAVYVPTRLLPRIHADPFDRLLIAQAVISGLTIVTADRRFAEYGVLIHDAGR